MLTVTDGVSTIRARFQPSYGTQGKTNGKIVVTDENLQRIFEADPKFNSAYYLSDQYEDTNAPEITESSTGEKYIAPTPSNKRRLRTQAEIDAENEAKNADEKKEKAKTKSAKSLSFKSKNEAIEYFTEHGETVASEDDLADLLNKYSAKITD